MNFSQHAEKNGRRNGNFLAVPDIVIFHGVLAGNAGNAVVKAIFAKGFAGSHQLGEFEFAVRCFFGLNGVTPAEVVTARHMVRVGTDSNGISYCLVKGICHHVIGVVVTEFWTNTVGNNNTCLIFQHGAEHSGVRRCVLIFSHKRFNNTAAAYFMVVLADNIFLTANIEAAQHFQKEIRLIVGVGHCHLVLHSVLLFALPHSFQLHLRQTVMHEIHRQISNGLVPVKNLEIAAVRKFSKGCCFHVHMFCKR